MNQTARYDSGAMWISMLVLMTAIVIPQWAIVPVFVSGATLSFLVVATGDFDVWRFVHALAHSSLGIIMGMLVQYDVLFLVSAVSLLIMLGSVSYRIFQQMRG